MKDEPITASMGENELGFNSDTKILSLWIPVSASIHDVMARQIRVIFNGRESSEPIISNMVLACKVPVNILLADTHDIGGKAMGQMLLQLPEDEVDAGRICNYLKTVGVIYEEVR